MLGTKNKSRVISAGLLATAISLLGTTSYAQVTTSAEFEAYMKALIAASTPQKNVYLPGVSHAVVAPHGTVYMSASLFGPRNGTPGNGADGAVAVGLGLGNADDGIGASITANITGTVPFGSDGDFTIKLAKGVNVGSGTSYVGLSFGRLAGWGANAGLSMTTEGSFTHFTNMTLGGKAVPIMVTLGVGNTSGSYAGFGGIGFGLTQNLGAGISLKGGKVTVGLGYKVPKTNGLSINLDASNVFKAGGTTTVYTLGVSYSFSGLF